MFALSFTVVASLFWYTAAKSCYTRTASWGANSSFFDAFNFEVDWDPTHGYVDYIGRDEASSLGLIKTIGDKVYIGVDYENVVPDYNRGRKSIRLSSKMTLKGNNLVVIDLDHMPSTLGKVAPAGCSTWPAFWTCGSNWPNHGEIDIIEYVNTDSVVLTTLHTSSSCNQESESLDSFSGQWATTTNNQPSDNCDVNAWDQYGNQGCGIISDTANTVGSKFNQRGTGGVYVMEWDSSKEIRAFFFPRNVIPSDLIGGKPNPDSWGKPYARFAIGDDSDCSSDHFSDHNIIFDTTFCGDWAGATFSSTCFPQNDCVSFVKYNPSEFSETYWLINAVEVYEAC